jgi:hypothetical protein
MRNKHFFKFSLCIALKNPYFLTQPPNILINLTQIGVCLKISYGMNSGPSFRSHSRTAISISSILWNMPGEEQLINIFVDYTEKQPVPVAVRSEAWACSRSSFEIEGSNPTGGMDVCLLRVFVLTR